MTSLTPIYCFLIIIYICRQQLYFSNDSSYVDIIIDNITSNLTRQYSYDTNKIKNNNNNDVDNIINYNHEIAKYPENNNNNDNKNISNKTKNNYMQSRHNNFLTSKNNNIYTNINSTNTITMIDVINIINNFNFSNNNQNSSDNILIYEQNLKELISKKYNSYINDQNITNSNNIYDRADIKTQNLINLILDEISKIYTELEINIEEIINIQEYSKLNDPIKKKNDVNKNNDSYKYNTNKLQINITNEQFNEIKKNLPNFPIKPNYIIIATINKIINYNLTDLFNKYNIDMDLYQDYVKQQIQLNDFFDNTYAKAQIIDSIQDNNNLLYNEYILIINVMSTDALQN